MATVEVIDERGAVVDQVELEPGVPVRLAGPTVRLVEPEPADPELELGPELEPLEPGGELPPAGAGGGEG